MNKLRQVLLQGYLLVPSLGCSVAGLWLGFRAALAGHHELARLGLIFYLGGMTVVPAALAILGNKLFRSERERLVNSRKAIPQARIKKMEKGLSHAKFIKRHPGVVFLFCLFALIVLAGAALAPLWVPDPRQAVVLHWMGIVFGLAYVLMLFLLSYYLFTKRWHPYMDSSILRLEARIAQARQENATDPAPEDPRVNRTKDHELIDVLIIAVCTPCGTAWTGSV